MDTSPVKQQYEELPYPPRNPEDERQRLVRTAGDDLAELNHNCFKGQRDFRKGFRCLVAGGGTGDSAIFLAEQLREFDAEIVYLDLSAASRCIAEQRAAVRELANIRWVTASLLDIPRLDLGKFDYVNCSGVLHHLPEPKEGLAALTSALHEDGALYLMLYGRYGRRGIYELQDVLRDLIPADAAASDKIATVRALLTQLPATNYFQRNRGLWAAEIGPGGYGDAGLYDLLLHSQDRAYDVDAVYDLLESSSLQLVGFTGPGKRQYRLEHLLQDRSLLDRCAAMTARRKYAMAEKLSGAITKHMFYAARTADRVASIDDSSLCVVLTAEMKDMHEQVSRAIVPGETLSITYAVDGKQEVFQLPGNAINKELFKYFDGRTPIETVVNRVKIKTGCTNPTTIKTEIQRAFDLLHSMGWAYLCSGQLGL